jgi:hypothetical protein
VVEILILIPKNISISRNILNIKNVLTKNHTKGGVAKCYVLVSIGCASI